MLAPFLSRDLRYATDNLQDFAFFGHFWKDRTENPFLLLLRPRVIHLIAGQGPCAFEAQFEGPDRISRSLYQGTCVLLGLFRCCQRLKTGLAKRDVLIVDKRVPHIIERESPVNCTADTEPSLIAVGVDTFHAHVYYENSNVTSLRETLHSS